ncbi:acyltransferase [Bradyrhizobium diazoefficiens]|nr:acyltransferase [Bradyrhizobium diazoefficiens]MBR0774542.1 acyltransferase [Bradyrhizobium diazoefficiens]
MTARHHRLFGLDLLRAIAILAVIVCHYTAAFAGSWGLEPPPRWIMVAGFYGVVLFFALSGYLIGNILFDIQESGTTMRKIRTFLVRRWMRTLPAYWIVVAASCVVAELYNYRSYDLLRFLTLTQNLVTPFPGGFFGASWSLTVEEWFYVLFPITLFCASLWLPRRGIVLTLSTFLVAPALARYGVWRWLDVDWSYGLRQVAILQLDAIAYGVLAAYLTRGRIIDSRRRLWLGVAGSASVLISWYFHASLSLADSPLWMSNGVFLTSASGSALVVVACVNLNGIGKLTDAAVTCLSNYAYALYLVHCLAWDIAALTLQGRMDLAPPVTLILALSLAALVRRLVETPFMRARPPQFGNHPTTNRQLLSLGELRLPGSQSTKY